MIERLILNVCLLAAIGLASLPAFADDEATAREHYKQGTKMYDLRRYRDAAREYEAAYELVEDPVLLFNIAQSYRFAGAYEDAIASYKSYVRHVPRASNRVEVETRIREMQELLAAQQRQQKSPPEGTLPPKTVEPGEKSPAASEKPAAEKSPPPVASEKPSPAAEKRLPSARGRQLTIAGATVFAVGVASLAIGGAFAGLAAQASDQLSHAKQDQPFDPSVQRRGQTDQAAAIGLFAVGGAAAITGVALLLVGRAAERRQSVAVVPSLAPNLAAIAVRGSF